MVNLQESLIKVVSEMSSKEFGNAIAKAELTTDEVRAILDAIFERGE